jgi:hypothetical protein
MGQVHASGWAFAVPRLSGIEVPVRPEEADALQRLCPAVRLLLGPDGAWKITADDVDDIGEIRAFVLKQIDGLPSSQAWRLRSVAYRLADAEEL